MPERLGLIQSRGIGDIIIALPIAKWYHDHGVEVHWPIDARFLSSFEPAVDYVRFIPFAFSPTTEGFVHQPLRLLKAVPCQRIVPLYSFLSNCAVNVPALFHSLKFDEYKYAVTGVPFAEKWRLQLKRNPQREQDFYNRVVRSENYIVVHRQGSNATTAAAIPAKYQGHQVIEIEELTDCIFDWLLVLERAKFLMLLDSCFANLVEQLGFPNEKIFLLRSEVRFTPVLRSNWSFGAASPAPEPAAKPPARREQPRPEPVAT
jgi:hypothetical protein